MAKTTLCIDARLISKGGIGTFLRNLIEALTSECDLTILCYKDEKTLFPKSCTLIEMQSPIYSIKEQGELAYKIPKVALFLSPHFNIPIFPIRAQVRISVIHDVFHLAHFSELSFMQKCYAKFFYNACCFLSDHVVTISNFSKEQIFKYIACSPKTFTVISHGVALPKETVRKRVLDFEYFLVVASAKAHKNLERLIEAFKRVECPEKLVIIGKDLSCLKEKRIHILSLVDDEQLASLYTHAKALIYPSLYEGFGLPPLEAMSFGCPVIASRIENALEIYKEGVEYVDPKDISSIQQGIMNILNSNQRRKQLIEKGFEIAHANSFERFKKQWIQLIQTESCRRS